MADTGGLHADESDSQRTTKRLKVASSDEEACHSGKNVNRLLENDDIFQRFKCCPVKVSALKSCFEQLYYWKHYALTAMTIQFCNASIKGDYGFSFSDAQCLTEFYSEKVFSFLKFFSHGKTLLEEFTERGTVPEHPYLRQILRRLLIYLLDCEDDQDALWEMTQKSKIPEATLAAAYGQHLLSKLSVSASFMLDRIYCHAEEFNQERKTCPCCSGKEYFGLFGDNSIGHAKCWHGCIDILVPGADIAVTVTKKEKPASRGGKSADIQSDKSSQQSIAQTIVFSYLQKKRHPEYEHFLIPTIGISKREIIFYFYDSKTDILLKSPPFALFTDSGVLRIDTVIACWLILHYKVSGSGVPDDVCEVVPRSNFCRLAEEKLKVYETELNIGGIRGKSFDFHYEPEVLYNAEFCV